MGSQRIISFLNVLEGLELEIRRPDGEMRVHSEVEEGKVLESIPGIGLFSALLLYSEIGDISRFNSSAKLLAYTGLILYVLQSSDIIHYGHITTQGSKYIRWIMVESLLIRVHVLQKNLQKQGKEQGLGCICKQASKGSLLGTR